MFNAIQSSMIKLDMAISSADDDEVLYPLGDTNIIGERMRMIYAASRTVQYNTLRGSVLRKLPFAYWIKGQDKLTQMEPVLVRQYWEFHLPKALMAGPKIAKLWLAPLLFVYCEMFTLNDPDFVDFAFRLRSLLEHAQGSYAQHLFNLHLKYNLFDPDSAPKNFSEYFFSADSRGLDIDLDKFKLWPSFVRSALGKEIYNAGLSLSIDKIRNEQAGSNLVDWSERYSEHVVNSESRVKFAHAVLVPWYGHQPTDSLKIKLVQFFMNPQGYGNPRYPAKLSHEWGGISNQAKVAFFNLVTWYTIHCFMKITQEMDDLDWQYRRQFWMAYHERGLIDRAWMILGNEAILVSNKLSIDNIQMYSGKMIGCKEPSQLAMILQMRDIIFLDWVNNQGLRGFLRTSQDAPQFYLGSYQYSDLLLANSMRLDVTNTKNTGIDYFNSKKGMWQRNVRDFIFTQTDVYLEDCELFGYSPVQ